MTGRLWLRAVRAAALALALLAGPLPAAAGPWEDATEAYERGDHATALAILRPLAEQGDAGAQFNLGVAYENGRGVAKDEREAVRWYRLAAQQGDADAQNNLGGMYAFGRGVAKDDREAEHWWRLAAEQGNPAAQHNLGWMYANGLGVAKDEREAVRWYHLAAEQGWASAQFNLGVMYVNGRGVPKDEREAVRWFRLAAQQGLALAQSKLGFMYALGQGVAKDDREAVRWWRLAADQGDASAQFNLGIMYHNGRGVAKDNVRAYMWANLAAAHGNEKAGELRELIAKKMTPAQIAEAQRLSSNWRPKASGEAAADGPGLPQPSAYGADPALIAEAQRLLGRLGYDAGPADGVAGRRTRGAVAAYQRASGMPEDGEIDADLVEHLRRAVAARAAPPVERQPAVTGSGSGFFVSAEGHVLSNAHVVKGCRRLRVQPPGGEAIGASLLARAAADDLALLKAETDPPAAAQFRTGAPLRQGESVLAYGFPLAGALASSGNATVGHVTALAGLGDDSRLLQISAPVQPGNSGGPLLDASGGVVGVIVGKLDALKTARAIGDIPQNVNFAIKASVATNFLEAQGVPFATQPAGRALATEDIAARARAITVRVDCLK